MQEYTELTLDSRLSRANATDPTMNRQYALIGGTRIYALSVLCSTIPFSWYNVRGGIHPTNSIKFSEDGGVTWTTITLPDGNYSAYSVQTPIGDAMTTASPTGKTYVCTMGGTSSKITIEETSGPAVFQLDVVVNSILYELLGFTLGVKAGATSYTGENIVFMYPENTLLLN
jgi:hypothetical protein